MPTQHVCSRGATEAGAWQLLSCWYTSLLSCVLRNWLLKARMADKRSYRGDAAWGVLQCC